MQISEVFLQTETPEIKSENIESFRAFSHKVIGIAHQ